MSSRNSYQNVVIYATLSFAFVLSGVAAGTPSCAVKVTSLPATGDVYTDSLDSGCQMGMLIQPGVQCNNSSYLHVELWDLSQLFSLQDAVSSGTRADPLLGMAQGSVPNASFISSGSWDIEPASAIFDTKAYELMRPYLHVQSAYSSPGSASSWYISLQNLNTWTSGNLDFQIRASCAQQPQCPAPALSAADGTPELCSGKGQCTADGSCSCNLGSGDVGCNIRTPVMGWGAEEAHTLSSSDWMYWELVLDQDAAAIVMELTRSSGDPLLFLKPQSAGFQVHHRRFLTASMIANMSFSDNAQLRSFDTRHGPFDMVPNA